MAKTVIEIVKEYLIKNGYDGLAGNECGCTLNKLAACEHIEEICHAAKKCDKVCEFCEHQEDDGTCRFLDLGCGPGDYDDYAMLEAD